MTAKKTVDPTATPTESTLKRPPKFKLIPLREIGQNLPIGILVDGQYVKDFGVRPFRLREEKAIGQFRAHAKGLTSGRLVAEVLGTMCPHIGPHNFDEMKPGEKLLAIAQMAMMDVLYVYLFIRIHALGGGIPLMVTCPNCRHNYPIDADLNDLDARVLEDPSVTDLSFEYELRDGLEIRGKVGRVLTIDNLLWGAMDTPEFEGEKGLNPANRDAALLKAGVRKVDGEPVVLFDQHLDELSLFDKTGLMDAMTEAMLGPVLAVEVACPKCTFEALQPIDWGYDSFFKRPSRSPGGRS